jgi:Protein kinase domain/PEGA domain
MSEPGELPQLGRYTLIRRIGKGGMGEVFLGKVSGAHGFEKAVAIKRILPQFSANPHVVNMLVDEARICVLLSHPNIVQVLELEEDAGDYFIVMEYVDGQALSRLMRALKNAKARLDPLEACYIAIQLLEGLHAAHIQKDHRGKPAGIIHRDVSPQNILVSMDGVVKVIDFGIARARERLEVTQGTSVKGKLRYMAPEQLSPKLIKGKPLDARADVFAAGIVLWEMLAMRQRFNADAEMQIMEQILKEDTPDLTRDGLVDKELMDIVDTALEKSRDDRFPDAATFAAKLRGYLYKRDPGFTTERVARRMREAFDMDSDARAPEGGRRGRDSGERPMHDSEDAEATRTAFRPESVGKSRRGEDSGLMRRRGAEVPVMGVEGTGMQKRRPRSRAPAVLLGLFLGALVLGGAFWFVVKPKLTVQAADAGPVAVDVELVVDVEPATARIAVTGRPEMRLASPARIRAMPGDSLELVIEADGYESVKQTVVMEPGAKPLAVKLAALPVPLDVRVVPKDAAVTVDGAPWQPGMTVTPGRTVEVHAEHPFAKAKSATATPRAGETLVVNLILEELGGGTGGARSTRGVLMLTTEPSGAEIYVDSRKIQGATPAEIPLAAGAHRVTVKVGGNEKTFTVDLAPGERLRKTIPLQ